MASGTIQRSVIPGTNTIKFDNGLIMAWGQESISCTVTTYTPIFPYRGTKNVDLASFGFTSVIYAWANVQESAGFCNATATNFSGTSITVQGAANSNSNVNVNYLAIGRWR